MLNVILIGWLVVMIYEDLCHNLINFYQISRHFSHFSLSYSFLIILLISCYNLGCRVVGQWLGCRVVGQWLGCRVVGQWLGCSVVGQWLGCRVVRQWLENFNGIEKINR